MSSYLSIYIVPKRKNEKEEKEHILLASYSRSSDIYQYFDENINPAFIGDSITYTPITKGGITSILADFEKDISSAKNRLVEYEKYATTNPDYIQEIIGLKDYISELQYWKNKASFIEDIIDNMNYYKDIEEVCCNID